MKLGYLILGILLSVASWYVLFTELAFTVPAILKIAVFFSALFFIMYGFYAPSNRKPEEPRNIVDKITDALENLTPFLIKVFAAASSIVVFGGSGLLFYSMFFAPWGAAIFIPLLGAPTMFVVGCLLLYMAIRI